MASGKEFRDAVRKALAEMHKAQRRHRWRRKPAQPGPGMIRKPPPPQGESSTR